MATKALDPDNVNEFRKSYSDSWFGIRLEGKTYPATLDTTAMAPSPDHVPISYISNPESAGKKATIINWWVDRDRLVRDYPLLGAIKFGPSVAYLQVKPKRQWKKGYYPNNVTIHVPNSELVKAHLPKLHMGSGNRAVVWQVFNREFWSPYKALDDLNNGEALGYPLSRSFSLYINDSSKNPLIGYKTAIAGAHTEKGFELLSNYKFLKDQWKRETKTECV